MIQPWYAKLRLRSCLKQGLIDLVLQEDSHCSFKGAQDRALRALRVWDDEEQGELSLMKLWTLA